MRFPTMWYVRPAKPLISLRILEYSSTVMLLTEYHLQFLSLTARLSLHLIKMPHSWKSHVTAHMIMQFFAYWYNCVSRKRLDTQKQTSFLTDEYVLLLLMTEHKLWILVRNVSEMILLSTHNTCDQPTSSPWAIWNPCKMKH